MLVLLLRETPTCRLTLVYRVRFVECILMSKATSIRRRLVVGYNKPCEKTEIKGAELVLNFVSYFGGRYILKWQIFFHRTHKWDVQLP
jgi:hypothetical protein